MPSSEPGSTCTADGTECFADQRDCRRLIAQLLAKPGRAGPSPAPAPAGRDRSRSTFPPGQAGGRFPPHDPQVRACSPMVLPGRTWRNSIASFKRTGTWRRLRLRHVLPLGGLPPSCLLQLLVAQEIQHLRRQLIGLGALAQFLQAGHPDEASFARDLHLAAQLRFVSQLLRDLHPSLGIHVGLVAVQVVPRQQNPARRTALRNTENLLLPLQPDGQGINFCALPIHTGDIKGAEAFAVLPFRECLELSRHFQPASLVQLRRGIAEITDFELIQGACSRTGHLARGFRQFGFLVFAHVSPSSLAEIRTIDWSWSHKVPNRPVQTQYRAKYSRAIAGKIAGSVQNFASSVEWIGITAMENARYRQ